MRLGKPIVTGLTAALMTIGALAGPAAATSNGPVYGGDFPDPSVTVAGGRYYAFGTGHASNLQVMRSRDLVTWGPVSDPLLRLPDWAAPPWTWAPGVIQHGATYVMYYTAHHKDWNQQCISVATSSSPDGPYRDSSAGPFICQRSLGGSIDPQPFLAPDGSLSLYLLWKSDNIAIGQPTALWAEQLTSNGRSMMGPAVKILDMMAPPSWQGSNFEGPAMVYHPVSDGRAPYFLFYGANAWDSAAAGSGYATCESPLGPCTNQSVSGPWLASRDSAQGPSGPAVFVDFAGTLRLAYHAWTGAVGYPAGNRSLFIDTLGFQADKPVLQ